MKSLKSAKRTITDFRKLVGLDTYLPELTPGTLIYGIDDHKKSILTSALLHEKQETVLFLLENEKKARLFFQMFQELGQENCYYYPSEESIPFEVLAKSQEIENQRAEVLARLSAREPMVLFAGITAIHKKLAPPDLYREGVRVYKTGERIDPRALSAHLVDAGYQRTPAVIRRGDFSVRGGIIDIFPVASPNPVRMELFDDEIDSLRTFDLDTQKSLEVIPEVMISPLREILCREVFDPALLAGDYENQLKKYETNPEAAANFRRLYRQLMENWQEKLCSNTEEYLYPYLFPEESTFLDYLPEESLLIIDEPKRVEGAFRLLDQEHQGIYTELLKKGKVLEKQHQIYLDFPSFTEKISSRRTLYLSLLPASGAFGTPYRQRVNGDFVGDVIPFFSKVDYLLQTIQEKVSQGYRVYLVSENEERKRSLLEEAAHQGILIHSSLPEGEEHEVGTDSAASPAFSPLLTPAPGIYFAPLTLEKGFEDKKGKNLFITELDIFNKKKKKVRQIYNKDAERIGSVYELEIGDFVVHASHGIGQYFGINTLEVEGIKNDYLVIKYKGEDKLYVPVEQVNNLQKFIGSEEKRPALNKLGGSEWQRTKARVQKSIEDMSEELLELYAQRKMSQGHSFSGDDFMQRDFEDAFPYEETEDQLRAIREIKLDMESQIPMDRLLCGDVGYGKTEVAMRAAFKAVRDSKQVAVLVPTTILAEQHYQSFTKRFADFPVTIQVLSRFRSPKEEKVIKDDVKKGKVDILIGTHKLLSKSLHFRDLGLLIVDEEQRFGVKHKEKIKQIKAAVDVLTLSATPIPRTLQMSLAGLRDMSLIETPPKNRYPIQTFVVEKNDALLREVILRETGRSGQVYYVHNRVQDIYLEAGKLMELVPESRFAIAHGQMQEQELEKTMLRFMEQDLDCLVCTTIIETGLDIPNVNTLIIDEADRFGLSQLYQLRGRVGRSDRVAYAYLTYKADKVLTENAEKRLKAIKDFTELGSGFKIALRDLEIRGAGNLLGREQHGHLDAIGFALYTQMLQETIERYKNKDRAAEQRTEAEIHLPVSALIPEDYIENQGMKLAFYQKIKNARTEEILSEITDEMIDRFGDFPEEVSNFLEIAGIRIRMENLGIHTLKLRQQTLELYVAEEANLDPRQIVSLTALYGNQVSFRDDGGFVIKYSIKYTDKDHLLREIKGFLRNLSKQEASE